MPPVELGAVTHQDRFGLPRPKGRTFDSRPGRPWQDTYHPDPKGHVIRQLSFLLGAFAAATRDIVTPFSRAAWLQGKYPTKVGVFISYSACETVCLERFYMIVV